MYLWLVPSRTSRSSYKTPVTAVLARDEIRELYIYWFTCIVLVLDVASAFATVSCRGLWILVPHKLEWTIGGPHSYETYPYRIRPARTPQAGPGDHASSRTPVVVYVHRGIIGHEANHRSHRVMSHVSCDRRRRWTSSGHVDSFETSARDGLLSSLHRPRSKGRRLCTEGEARKPKPKSGSES